MPLLTTITSSGMTLDDLTRVLLIGSLVMLVAVAAVRLSTRSGLPSLLIYLAIGLALGNAGAGIQFDNASVTRVLGYAALVLILSEGGLTTSWGNIKDAVAPAAVLSTVGVAVSVIVVAVAAHTILPLSWTISLLVGAIVTSTDAAAVFAVLRNVPLPKRLSGMLEAEAGFNDAPVVILVVAFAAQGVPGAEAEPWYLLVGSAAFELVGGALVGVAVGWVGGQLLKRAAGGSSALFSIGIVTLTVLAYALGTAVHVSGFLATYLSALVLGNMGLPYRTAFQSFGNALGWIAQIGLFVLLGLLADPFRLDEQIVPAVVIGLVLLLVARPLSVIASTSWFGLSWRDQAFLSWAGLRGAVPVVLATVPLVVGTPDTEWIFDLVFMLVVVFTIVQAPTLPWVARRLGLVEDVHSVDVDLESTTLIEIGADVLQVSVGDQSRLHGVAVFELRLPKGANVTLVVRDGESFVPAPHTTIRHGDRLLVVAPSKVHHRTEQRIRAVSRDGRLAGWP
ncbi:potassium/proton antiporter [Terracoccus luteus]|uniref:Cell volume regulation protein A n=1 Tax=Terracoccus luteus TaxID=53356 RepID=A0A839PTD9_9MICO|nr:potassium/proton antiporter [Terracoccus luteus]MBB2986024.1 cell volume regulation protein A [Terracoccus luteus]MCP2171676.1 cell volume regulation protein A [Terracoccus luteus]